MEIEAKVKEKDTEIAMLHAKLKRSKDLEVKDEAVETLKKQIDDIIHEKDEKIA